MTRIVVIGCSASGKSTLSRLLAETLRGVSVVVLTNRKSTDRYLNNIDV